MVKESKLPQKILKYSVLLSIKESYLFSRNLFGLYKHPFKTLRAIFREEDASQFFLLFSLPIFIIVVGLGVVWLGRRLIHVPKGEWGILTYGGVLGVFVLSFLLLLYLGFWFYRVYKSNSKSEFRNSNNKYFCHPGAKR